MLPGRPMKPVDGKVDGDDGAVLILNGQASFDVPGKPLHQFESEPVVEGAIRVYGLPAAIVGYSKINGCDFIKLKSCSFNFLGNRSIARKYKKIFENRYSLL
jgi:hypothetical protein